MRAAVSGWGLVFCANRKKLYSNTVGATLRSPRFDASLISRRAAQTYDMAFGVGLGDVDSKVLRIGHPGRLFEP